MTKMSQSQRYGRYMRVLRAPLTQTKSLDGKRDMTEKVMHYDAIEKKDTVMKRKERREKSVHDPRKRRICDRLLQNDDACTR